MTLGSVIKTDNITENISALLPPYKLDKNFVNTPGSFYDSIQWKGVKFNTTKNVESSQVHNNSEVKVLVDSEKCMYEYGTIEDIFIPDNFKDHILVCIKWWIIIPFDEELQPLDDIDIDNKNNKSKKRKKNISEDSNTIWIFKKSKLDG